ncbi:hypothetical protein V7968_16340 [Nocardia vulneris]|uniref:hypothetical protein n=1 Tax=Nocardia vulneris TaxID=1141657 RepID=UPI0030CB95BB
MLDSGLNDDGIVSNAYDIQLEAIRCFLLSVSGRRSDVLPGLKEYLQDNVLINMGGARRRLLGFYQCGAWQHEGRDIDELFINADRRCGHDEDRTIDVAITALHELAHADNHRCGVVGCSNRGRYHNKRFAQVAALLGLQVVRHPVLGHTTPSLQGQVMRQYADLLSELDKALTLAREPKPVALHKKLRPAAAVTTSTPPALTDNTKYIFATCACRAARGGLVTFRMAKGSWREDVAITCSACSQEFGVSTTVG